MTVSANTAEARTPQELTGWEPQPEKNIEFPEGIIGFQEFKNYIFRPLSENENFLFLQSMEDPQLNFVILPIDRPWLNPASWLKAEHVLKQVAILELNPDNIVIAVILTVDETGGISANLRAPLVIDVDANKAWQVILDDPSYPVCFPLPQE